MGLFSISFKSWGVVYILTIKAYSNKTWAEKWIISLKNYAVQCKSMQIRSRDLETAIVLEKKLKQSKKLIPYISLDERLNICARALLNNLLKVEINGILF